MTSLTELNKLVRDTINTTITITDVIVYNPNAPRPESDYCTVYIAQMNRVGTIDKKYETSGEDLLEQIVPLYEAMISLQFYRLNALQNAGLVGIAFHYNSVIEAFNEAKVGFIRVSDVRELPLLIDSGHEDRAQVDIFIQFELTPEVTTEIVTGIDAVRIVGDIDNQAAVIATVDLLIESTP